MTYRVLLSVESEARTGTEFPESWMVDVVWLSTLKTMMLVRLLARTYARLPSEAMMNWVGVRLPWPKLKDDPVVACTLTTVGNPPGKGGVADKAGGAHPAAVAVAPVFAGPIVVTSMRSTPDVLKAKIFVLSGDTARKAGVAVREGISAETPASSKAG